MVVAGDDDDDETTAFITAPSPAAAAAAQDTTSAAPSTGTNGLETAIALRLDQGGNFFLLWSVEHVALQHFGIQQKLTDCVVDLDRRKRRHVRLDATEEVVFSVMILSNTYIHDMSNYDF